MDGTNKIETPEVEQKATSRRQFVKTSAQVAVTAPAVAMLLSATTKPAFADTDPDSYVLHGHPTNTGGNTGNAHDDPNHNEDVDACAKHNNTDGNVNPGHEVDDVYPTDCT